MAHVAHTRGQVNLMTVPNQRCLLELFPSSETDKLRASLGEVKLRTLSGEPVPPGISNRHRSPEATATSCMNMLLIRCTKTTKLPQAPIGTQSRLQIILQSYHEFVYQRRLSVQATTQSWEPCMNLPVPLGRYQVTWS